MSVEEFVLYHYVGSVPVVIHSQPENPTEGHESGAAS